MIEPGCFSWVTLPPSAALSWMIIFIASSANGFPRLDLGVVDE